MKHDDPRGERIAGWFHIGFFAMYFLAGLWHLKGARDHFRDVRKPD